MVSATNIVTGTLGFMRRHIADIAKWSAAYLAVTALSGLTMGPMMARLHTTPNPGAGFFLTFGVVWLAVMAVVLILVTAAMRAALRPEERAFGYMRLGADELRMLGLGLLLMLLVLAIYLVLVLAIVAVVAAFAAIRVPVVGALIAVPAALATFAAIVFIWVRLSISIPLTLWRRKIAVREAWRLSRGHFWSLFGGYFLVMLILYVVMIPVFMISAAPMFAAMMHNMSDPQAMQRAIDAQAVRQAGLTPLNLVMMLVSAAFGGVAVAAQGGMMGTALLGLLTDTGEVGLAEIFGGEPVRAVAM